MSNLKLKIENPVTAGPRICGDFKFQINIPFLLALLLLCLCFFVPVYRLFTIPPDRVFVGTRGYSDDYNVYTSTIMEGIRGRWTVVSKYNSEPHPGTLIHIEYLLSAKIFGPLAQFQISNPVLSGVEWIKFQIPPAALVYHLFLLSTFVLSLWAVWQLVKEVFSHLSREARRAAGAVGWLLILFSGVLPDNVFAIFSSPSGWMDLPIYHREPEILSRFAAQPHFSIGNITLILGFVLLLRAQKQKTKLKRYLLLSSLLAFFTCFAEPVSVLTLAVVLWIFTFLTTLIDIPRQINCAGILSLVSRHRIPLLFAVVVSLSFLPPALYLKHLSSLPPWNIIANFESQQGFHLSIQDYIYVYGLPLLLAPISFLLLFIRKSRVRRDNQITTNIIELDSTLLLLSWLLAFVLLMYGLSPIIGISQFRFFHLPIFIAFDILAAVAIVRFAQFVHNRFQSISTLFLSISLSLLVILPTVPSTTTFFSKQLTEWGTYPNYSTLIYPTTDRATALYWLRDNTPENSVVAALYEVGNIIPVFSGAYSYTGNVSTTASYKQKSALLLKFFSGQMTPPEALSFLTTSGIGYLYYGFQEKAAGGNLSNYQFLKEVYSTPQVTLFSFSL
jgi:hypothetical protein